MVDVDVKANGHARTLLQRGGAEARIQRLARDRFPAPRVALTLALAASLLRPGAARADEPAPPEASSEVPLEDLDEEEIHVTVRGATAGGFVSRTSTDEAPREAIDAGSILAELPSVHVRRLGADGSFGSLSVRGSASTQVAVVLAGIPITSGADPSVDIGSMPLWPAASFRVYRGFAPAAVGATGYLGGVLVIDPPSVLAGSRTEVWTGAGSFGALKLRAGDVRRVGATTWSTALSASRSDGDFTYELADARGDLRERTRTNAGHVAVSGIERATLDTGWGSVGATLLADARRQGLAGTSFHPTLEAELATSRVAAGVDARVRSGKASSFHAALWARHESASFDDPRGELSVVRPTSAGEDVIESTGGSFGWRGRAFEALTLDLFADGRAERFVPSKSRLATPGTRAKRFAGGLGVDASLRASGPLTLAASARVDARRDDADGALGPGGSRLGVSNELTPSGHVGASYRVSDALIASAHAGALERPPSFVELYGDRGSILGDPSLSPERALSLDAGLAGDLASADARFGYEVVGFVSSAHDLITFEELGEGTLIAKNVDRATIVGAELTLRLDARRLRTQVSYTWLSTENTSDAPLARGRPLPGRPVHDLAYDAAYRVGPLGLRYALDAVAGTTVDTSGRLALPARVLHGLGASLDVPQAPGLRVGVQVDNLFDLRTLHLTSGLRDAPIAVPLSDFLDFPLPGRTIWVTARWGVDGP